LDIVYAYQSAVGLWECVVRFANNGELREGWRKLDRAAAQELAEGLSTHVLRALPLVDLSNTSAVILPISNTANNPLFDRPAANMSEESTEDAFQAQASPTADPFTVQLYAAPSDFHILRPRRDSGSEKLVI
jgi:hypothetical protein